MIYEQCCDPKGSQNGSQFKVEEGETCCPVANAIVGAFTKICDCMKLSRSTISHHFKELQNAGLITCEREGRVIKGVGKGL